MAQLEINITIDSESPDYCNPFTPGPRVYCWLDKTSYIELVTTFNEPDYKIDLEVHEFDRDGNETQATICLGVDQIHELIGQLQAARNALLGVPDSGN